MGIAERKVRQRAEREARIIDAARTTAAREGWGAVTIRRLADEIEHSQPVLYSHFEDKDAIIAAVAVQGFSDLAARLRHAAAARGGAEARAVRTSLVYLAFAREHPALYEAMFTLPLGLRFAQADTRSELKQAWAALAGVMAPARAEVDLATETLWAALHGLVELERSGRIRPGVRDDRVAFMVRSLLGSYPSDNKET